MTLKRYRYGKQFLTLSEWSDITDIPVIVLQKRLDQGLAVSQVLGYEPIDEPTLKAIIGSYRINENLPGRMRACAKDDLSYKGKTQPICDWEKETGILSRDIILRLRMGWTAGEALGFETREEKINYKGKEHTLSQWSRIRGIPETTIYVWMEKFKWTAGQALGFESPPINAENTIGASS